MLTLWIDPGTTTLWYAIVEVIAGKIVLIDYGVVATPPKMNAGEKLREIRDDLESILQKYPTIKRAGIEKLYFGSNITTGIAVAECRWVVVELLTRNNITRSEFTPLQVKKWICGNGRATKQQVQSAIQSLFKLASPPKPDDAADAIAIAYLSAIQQY